MTETSLEDQLLPQTVLSRNKRILHIILLGIVTVLSYGFAFNKLGFYWDDVGIVFAKFFYGTHGMREYNSVDREFAKYPYAVVTKILGFKAWHWHIYGILVWWCVASLFYTFMRSLFKNAQNIAIYASLFFVVFPTFSSMFVSIIYSMIFLSLIWLLLSLILMEKYLTAQKGNLIYLVLSLGLVVLEIFQVEYWFGLEVARFLFILVILSNKTGFRQLFARQNLIKGIKKYLPYAIVLVLFVIWRLTAVKSLRASTDTHMIINELAKHPVQGIFVRLRNIFADVLITTFFSWVQSFGKFFYQNVDSHTAVLWVVLLLVFGLVVYIVNKHLIKPEKGETAGADERRNALNIMIIGVVVIFLGNLPLGFALYRIIQDTLESRAGLPAVFGSSIFLGAFVVYVARTRRDMAIWVALFVGAAAAYQCRNNFIAAKEEAYNKDLFYQLSWRVPQLEKGTSVIMDLDSGMRPSSIRYAHGLITNGVFGVSKDHTKQFYGFRFTNEFGNSMPAFAPDNHIGFQQFNYFTFNGTTSKLLVVSQPWHGCVRVVDSANKNFMTLSPRTRAAASMSNVSLVHANDSNTTNADWLNAMFGPPNKKCWCYYFEKAELARQKGDWAQVTAAIEDAQSKKLKPDNDEEWVTYVEGCLHTKKYQQIEDVVNKEVKTVMAKTYIFNMLKEWANVGTDGDKQAVRKLMALPFAYKPSKNKDKDE